MTMLSATQNIEERPLVACNKQRLISRSLGVFTSVKEDGGSESVMRDMAKAFLAEGAKLTVFCPVNAAILKGVTPEAFNTIPIEHVSGKRPRSGIPSELASDAVRNVNVMGRLWRLLPSAIRDVAGFVRDAMRFRKILRHHSLDCLFLHVNGSEAAVIGARLAGIKTIGCYHLSVPKLPTKIIPRCVTYLKQLMSMWMCHHVIHVSYSAQCEWTKYTRFPVHRTTVIHNGVALRQSSVTPRAALGCNLDDFVVCVPARLDLIKGVDCIIRAAALARRTIPNLKILMCGNGPLEQECQSLIRELRLDKCVSLLGWRTDVDSIMRASDVVVLPSRSENLSIAAIEASLIGKALIVTNVGGMTELVEDYRTGLVVEPQNVEALSAAMNELRDNATLRAELAVTAQAKAMSEFTLIAMCEQYISASLRLSGSC